MHIFQIFEPSFKDFYYFEGEIIVEIKELIASVEEGIYERGL